MVLWLQPVYFFTSIFVFFPFGFFFFFVALGVNVSSVTSYRYVFRLMDSSNAFRCYDIQHQFVDFSFSKHYDSAAIPMISIHHKYALKLTVNSTNQICFSHSFQQPISEEQKQQKKLMPKNQPYLNVSIYKWENFQRIPDATHPEPNRNRYILHFKFNGLAKLSHESLNYWTEYWLLSKLIKLNYETHGRANTQTHTRTQSHAPFLWYDVQLNSI